MILKRLRTQLGQSLSPCQYFQSCETGSETEITNYGELMLEMGGVAIGF